MKWTRKVEDVYHGEAELQKEQALLRQEKFPQFMF